LKALKNTTQLLAEARELEQASRLTEAAGVYQQLVDADPADQKSVSRLLILYRRLKEPKKELAVIESALSAYAQRGKTIQEKWISAHPQAARAGRAFLRSLGGSTVSAFGSNPIVTRLLKRKELLEKKLYGKGQAGKEKVGKEKAGKSKAAPKASPAKTAEAAKKKQAVEERKQAAQRRKQEAEERKRETQQMKTEAKKQKPSLFIISLRYLAPLEKIDALLPKHTVFLDKHFAVGDFLIAGRQVPRTGGIIIARGKDRASMERIMQQDPFVKRKLASVDIVEFTPGETSQKQWLNIK
jgi:uncharacterized protein YciI